MEIILGILLRSAQAQEATRYESRRQQRILTVQIWS